MQVHRYDKCATLRRDADSGVRDVDVWVQGVYGKSLYFSLTFALNLKLL